MLITVGRGKDRPQGKRVEVEDLAEALGSIEPAVEAWWSPHLWAGDRRGGDAWEGACSIACDVDFGDGKGAHLALTDEARQAVLFAWEEGILPGSVFHLTPRGFRIVFPLDQPAGIPEREAYVFAARATGLAVKAAIEAAGLAALGFDVDLPVTEDLARLLYTPRSIVNGVARDAKPLDRGGVYTLDALTPPPPPPPDEVPAPPPSDADDPLVGARRERNPAIGEAIAKWNAEHPREYPRHSGPCPACGAAASFGHAPATPSRWFCFAAGHGDRAATCGIKGPKGYHGDALDLDAFQAGMGRLEFLTVKGYLTPRDLAPKRSKPSILVPGTNYVPNDAGKVEALDVGTDAFAACVLAELPEGLLYRRGRVVGTMAPSDEGGTTFRALTTAAARMMVDAHVALCRWSLRKGKGEEEAEPVQSYVPCTTDLAGLLIEAASVHPRVRNLRLLTPYPVFAGPSLALVKPGWNEGPGVFYDEPEDLRGLVEDASLGRDVFGVMRDLLCDFPFAEEADTDNAVGFCLTVLLRPAIDGNVPMHVVLSSMERTGKTLLVNGLSTLLTGRDAPTLQMGGDEAEREKRITTLILEGTTLVHLDNLATQEEVDSASLASLLTSRTWKGRILGRSEMPELPNGVVLVGSGNNVRASSEITKRIVPVTLRPRTAEPHKRTDFRHPNFPAHVRRERRRILSVLIGAVAAWRDSGRPAARPGTALGGFESWVENVGGVLAYIGATGWLANLARWQRRSDEWGADLDAFVEGWWKRFGRSEVTTAALLSLAKELSLFPRVTARPEAGQAVALGRYVLRPACDRPVALWRVRASGAGSAARYALEPNPAAGEVPPEGHDAPPPPPAAQGRLAPPEETW